MNGASATDFGHLARLLGSEARRGGLIVPGFRSRPGADARRTIRRADSGAIVSVLLRGRSLADVAIDMVEGVVVANGLVGGEAVRWRSRLLAAVGADERAA